MTPDPTRINLQTNVKKNQDPTLVRMSGIARHGNTPFDVPFITQIDNNLWQGGCQNGLILPTFFKHVISLYPWEKYQIKHGLSSELSVRMYDSLDQAYDQIETIARWVNICSEDAPTLINCQAGLNRSSLVAARALMLKGITADEAIKILREKRSPACLCNPAFEQYLRDIDEDWIP